MRDTAVAFVDTFQDPHPGVTMERIHHLKFVHAAALSMAMKTARSSLQKNIGENGWPLAQIGKIPKKSRKIGCSTSNCVICPSTFDSRKKNAVTLQLRRHAELRCQFTQYTNCGMQSAWLVYPASYCRNQIQITVTRAKTPKLLTARV